MIGDDTQLRLRPMESELSLLSNADGSARVQHGDTCVVIGIWGPVDVKQSNQLPDRAALEVSVKYCTGQGSPVDTYYEEAVRNICQEIIVLSEHPRTVIQVHVQVECDDGSLLAAMSNALCLALMDAGLPMKCMISAISCATFEDKTNKWDPTQEEEAGAVSEYTFVYESVQKNVIYNYYVGETDIANYMLFLRRGRQLANQVFEYYRESFEKVLRKDVKFQLLLPSSNATPER